MMALNPPIRQVLKKLSVYVKGCALLTSGVRVVGEVRSTVCIRIKTTSGHLQPMPRNNAQERLKALKKSYGSKEVGNVTAEKVIGGMRGITVRFYAVCVDANP